MPVRRVVHLAVAAAALVALVATGHVELALTVAPALLVVALPLVHRFPGEALIVARRAVAAVRRLRPARNLWPRRRALALTSLLERAAHTLRGPPVAA